MPIAAPLKSKCSGNSYVCVCVQVCVCVCVYVCAQSCLTLCDPMEVHQASLSMGFPRHRILE